MIWLLLLTTFVAGAGFGYRLCLARQRGAQRRRHLLASPTLLRPYVPPRPGQSTSATTAAPDHDRPD